MTEAIYLEVTEKTEAAKKAGRRVSVSGMLKFLGVSRSGYLAWLHHVPSDTEKRRKAVKAKIQDIYDDSKQNYGAPKITVELRKTGEVISERTVGTYMRQMGIRAQWSKPWTITTKDSDFSTELQKEKGFIFLQRWRTKMLCECVCFSGDQSTQPFIII